MNFAEIERLSQPPHSDLRLDLMEIEIARLANTEDKLIVLQTKNEELMTLGSYYPS